MWLPLAPLILTGWLILAYFGQRDVSHAGDADIEASASSLVSGHAEVKVTGQDADVYVRPDETSYVLAILKRGERVKVRDTKTPGWLAIDPPPATISWIERSSIEPGSEPADEGNRAPHLGVKDVRGGKLRNGCRCGGHGAIWLCQGPDARAARGSLDARYSRPSP